MIGAEATRAVVRVGDGRGFVVQGRHDRYIITAAHCLPGGLPPAHRYSYSQERMYENAIGKIGAELSVTVECQFVDPVADIALLGSPDNQTYFEEADAYETLVSELVPFPIAKAPNKGRAWLLSYDEVEWFSARIVGLFGDSLQVECRSHGVAGGMSGSPILLPNGAAIAVVTNSSAVEICREGDGPALTEALPGRFLKELSPSRQERRTS